MINPKKIEKSMAIMYYGRSGSVFLQSLLDGHPNILSIPTAALMDFFSHFWPAHCRLPKEKLILSFVQYYPVIFNAENPNPEDRRGGTIDAGIAMGLTQMGDEKNQILKVDPFKFISVAISYLAKEENITQKYFFQVIHLAYAIASGRNLDQNDYWICYQFHSPDKNAAIQLVTLFPETFFLQTIRDPAQTINSHFRHYFLFIICADVSLISLLCVHGSFPR